MRVFSVRGSCCSEVRSAVTRDEVLRACLSVQKDLLECAKSHVLVHLPCVVFGDECWCCLCRGVLENLLGCYIQNGVVSGYSALALCGVLYEAV